MEWDLDTFQIEAQDGYAASSDHITEETLILGGEFAHPVLPHLVGAHYALPNIPNEPFALLSEHQRKLVCEQTVYSRILAAVDAPWHGYTLNAFEPVARKCRWEHFKPVRAMISVKDGRSILVVASPVVTTHRYMVALVFYTVKNCAAEAFVPIETAKTMLIVDNPRTFFFYTCDCNSSNAGTPLGDKGTLLPPVG